MNMLRDFEAFLSKTGTVPEYKIRFYVYWVRRFFKGAFFKKCFNLLP